MARVGLKLRLVSVLSYGTKKGVAFESTFAQEI